MKLLFSALGLSAALLATPAGAACRLNQVIAPGITATYDPFEVDYTPSPVVLAVQTTGNCDGARIELALAPTSVSPQTGSKARLVQNGNTLAATVLAANQPRPIVATGAAFTTNPLSLPVGATGQILGDATLALTLEPGQVAGPGSYGASLNLLARLTDAQGRQSVASTEFNLNVSVKPSVRMAVGAGDLVLDLGELKPGVVGGPVNFDAYANVDYSLLLRSENGFVMRREGGGTAIGIPYVPVISNGTISERGGNGDVSDVRQALFDAPGDGMRHHALRVRVPPFADVGAGHYSDVLTLEIRARV